MTKKTIQLVILLALVIVFFIVGRQTLASHYHTQATRFYQQGRYDQAIDLLKRSIRLAPGVSMAHYNLGAAYAMSRSYDEAIRAYRQALALDPVSVSAYRGLAQAYVALKQYDVALAELDRALNFYPENEQLAALVDETTLGQAIDELNRGVESYFQADTQAAYRQIREAVRIKPDFAFAHYLLGFLYYQDRDLANAEKAVMRSIGLNAQLWLAQKLLGDIAFEQSQYTRAIECYKAGLAVNRKDPSLYNDLGLAYMQQEDYQQAALMLEEAWKLEPDNLDRLYNLASVYRDNRDLQEAADKYLLLIARQPDYPNVHNDLGDIYKRQGMPQEALRQYRQEIFHTEPKSLARPQDVTLLNILSNAYRGLGDFEISEALIRRALALDPGYRQGYLTLASIQQDTGKLKQSLASLEKAKSLPGVTNFIVRGQHTLREALRAAPGDARSCPDTVFLKNGRAISGLIIEEAPEKVVLELPLGSARGSITVYRNDIRLIERKDQAEAPSDGP